MVGVSASHAVDHRFASRSGHTSKDHHNMVQSAYLLGTRDTLNDSSLTIQSDCFKDRVMCGNENEDMHLKYPLLLKWRLIELLYMYAL